MQRLIQLTDYGFIYPGNTNVRCSRKRLKTFEKVISWKNKLDILSTLEEYLSRCNIDNSEFIRMSATLEEMLIILHNKEIKTIPTDISHYVWYRFRNSVNGLYGLLYICNLIMTADFNVYFDIVSKTDIPKYILTEYSTSMVRKSILVSIVTSYMRKCFSGPHLLIRDEKKIQQIKNSKRIISSIFNIDI